MKNSFTKQTGHSTPLVLSTPANKVEFNKFKIKQNHTVTMQTYIYDLYTEVQVTPIATTAF